jgi:hypothetical protein
MEICCELELLRAEVERVIALPRDVGGHAIGFVLCDDGQYKELDLPASANFDEAKRVVQAWQDEWRTTTTA